MVELEFEYLQFKYVIQVNLTDSFSKSCDQFYQKAEIIPKSVFFMANSILLTGDKKIGDIMNETEKYNKKMHISVFPLYLDGKDKVIVESKEVICPKCLEQCRIKIQDYIVYLYNCKNNHSIMIRLDKI